MVSPGTPVSSTNKTDLHDITEILLKMMLTPSPTKKCVLFPIKIAVFLQVKTILLNKSFFFLIEHL
jgi:hypothetical protein